MILRHCITIVTPMGQQIIPQVIMDADLDGFINMLRMTQGVDKKQIKLYTDIELEESEYEIIEINSQKGIDIVKLMC
jgi:hypothetical protein